MPGYFPPPNTAGGGAVDSVNGETGVVVLDKSDVGLGNVDNTADASKPVSTAQQTALDAKLASSAVSAFALTMLDDTTAAAVLATLKIGQGVALTKSAVQALTTGTSTAITFDGEEFDDAGTFHDTGSNTARITIPANYGGLYLIGGSIEFDSIADAKSVLLRIRKNGTTVLDGRARQVAYAAGGTSFPGPAYSRLVKLAAGDWVELMGEHNEGADRNVRTSANGTSFWAVKLG